MGMNRTGEGSGFWQIMTGYFGQTAGCNLFLIGIVSENLLLLRLSFISNK